MYVCFIMSIMLYFAEWNDNRWKTILKTSCEGTLHPIRPGKGSCTGQEHPDTYLLDGNHKHQQNIPRLERDNSDWGSGMLYKIVFNSILTILDLTP